MLTRRLLRQSSAQLRLRFRQPHRPISALYVTGDKANQSYVALTPYFDFATRLEANEAQLLANIRSRRLPSTDATDLPQLLQLWSLFRDVQQRKAALERRRSQIADTLKMLHKNPDAPDFADLQRKYKADGIAVRDDLKRLKENSYAMEDQFVHRYLALPNDLHPRTPCGSAEEGDHVLHSTQLLQPSAEVGAGQPAPNHLLAAGGLLEYHNPYRYYLLAEAAEFELAAVAHFCAQFRLAGFARTSNPDFCRTLLAEAAGQQADGELLAVLQDGEAAEAVAEADASRINRTHLAGAGSDLSFFGYCAKLLPFQSALPMRLVASGREYRRRDGDCAPRELGLYAVAQSTVVHQFQAAASAEEAERCFDEAVAVLVREYARFGRRMRVVQVSADRLRPAEAMRADVEMWSAARKEFVRIADVRYYGDYVSKRLLFSYKEVAGGEGGKKQSQQQQQPRFAHLIGGSVVDVSRLLAVLWESGDHGVGERFVVPEFMREQ